MVDIKKTISLPKNLQAHIAIQPSNRKSDTERAEILQKQLARRDSRIQELENYVERLCKLNIRDSERINPANMTWILGSARTGSSWLARMLRNLKFAIWDEPLIGEVFGSLRGGAERFQAHLSRTDFALSEERDTGNAVRSFILQNAATRFPNASTSTAIAVKEPHAAQGAPIVMRALPESKMLWLMRDPRDVAASGIDAHRPGSWATSYKTQSHKEAEALSAARERAEMYVYDMDAARVAYEAHSGPKAFVRYEDLRAEPVAELTRILFELGYDQKTDKEAIVSAVETESWEAVPAEQKGPGKGKRKAIPGGWREDLTSEQVQIVEDTTRPFIDKFYS